MNLMTSRYSCIFSALNTLSPVSQCCRIHTHSKKWVKSDFNWFNSCRSEFSVVRNLSTDDSAHIPIHVTNEKTNSVKNLANSSNSSGIISSSLQPSSKPKLRVQDILLTKSQEHFTIPYNSSVNDALNFLTKQKLSSALVLNEDQSIEGIFTARDVLTYISKHGLSTQSTSSSNNASSSHNRIETNKSNNTISNNGISSVSGINYNLQNQVNALNSPITNVMTGKDKLVYCSPNDSVRHCREIMFQLKIRHMPVLNQGQVIGIITIKDLADSAFSLVDIGGKKGFIHNVTGRKGIPAGIKLHEFKTEDSSSRHSHRRQIEVDYGSFALPHPFKSSDGVASSRRTYGALDLCTDLSYCEDAHFTIRVAGIPATEPSQVYLCVADGVGSWRQYGVDPRRFADKLVRNAQGIIQSDVEQRRLLSETGWGVGGLGGGDQGPVHPLDVVYDAWNMALSEKVNGSSTICVATLDLRLSQLSYANIGDCGLMVIRHIDSDIAGYMRERQQPRHLRTSDLRIAFLSQQQLRSFNLPYQLGYSNIPEHKGSFESPTDADKATIALLPGDVVVLATDGLYDNLDLHEIVDEITAWEKRWFPSTDGSEIQKASLHGETSIQELARQLVYRAREYSLDKQRDSPFAVLAKENDILWGGGMPDDTTVIVARIFNPNSIGSDQ